MDIQSIWKGVGKIEQLEKMLTRGCATYAPPSASAFPAATMASQPPEVSYTHKLQPEMQLCPLFSSSTISWKTPSKHEPSLPKTYDSLHFAVSTLQLYPPGTELCLACGYNDNHTIHVIPPHCHDSVHPASHSPRKNITPLWGLHLTFDLFFHSAIPTATG